MWPPTRDSRRTILKNTHLGLGFRVRVKGRVRAWEKWKPERQCKTANRPVTGQKQYCWP